MRLENQLTRDNKSIRVECIQTFSLKIFVEIYAETFKQIFKIK